MFDFCNSEINGIHFILIRKEEMEDVRKNLKLRCKMGSTVPGTRTYHCFIPISTHEIQFERASADAEFSGYFKFTASLIEGIESKISEVKIMDFFACYYDMHWLIGLLEDINREKKDCKKNLMHPHSPAASFCWPVMDEISCVPFDKLIYNIEAPETVTGRT